MRVLHDFAATAARLTVVIAVAAVLALAARPATQGAAVYTLYTADGGRRALPFRGAGNADMISLDQLASLFNLTLTEDTLVGGLTVQGRGQAILLTSGQSFASIGPGRIVSLPAVVQHDRGGWSVPVDFIRLALGPALNLKVDIRRSLHVILVGDVRLPNVTARMDRQGQTARLTIDFEPPAPRRIIRDGNRLVVRADAVALDFSPVSGLVSDFVTGIHTEGPALVIDLGPSAGTPRTSDADDAHLVIDFTAPGAPPVPAAPAAGPVPRSQTSEPAPFIETAPAGSIRTVVIDPGHGGGDEGVHGPAGTKEKDLVLDVAKRLKTTIENRMGLRVLLTRDGDNDVPIDRRTSLANNNKADLLISLHANGSVKPDTHGAEVSSLGLETYRNRVTSTDARDLPVPVATGGTRPIEIVRWDFAQIPFARTSAAFADALLRHLDETSIPMFSPTAETMPLRMLVGANMPAVMVDLGFLTNADDEQALTGQDRSGKIIDAIVATIDDMRRGAVTGARP